MSLTLHIVFKDIFRLRWIILLWVVAIAGELGLASIQTALDVEGHLPFYMAAWTFGNLFIPVIGYGLVMGLQDDDPVTEGDAFWMTRPITGARLLSAKALALLLLCLVPVVACVPFWLGHDFGLGLVERSSEQVFWRQILISLLAVPFALISSSGGKFVTNTLVGAVALLALALIYRLLQGPDAPGSQAYVLIHRDGLIMAVWTFASAAMALNQYLRRRTRLSTMILVTAVVTCFAISRLWEPKGAVASVPAEIRPSTPQMIEVGAREGAHITLGGRTIRILSVIPDYSHTILMEVSESEPDSGGEFPSSLGGPADSVSIQDHYLIVSQDDGRAMTAKVTRNPEELHAGGLRYFRTTLVFDPARELSGEVPANMAPWIGGAVLVKVEGRGAGIFQLKKTKATTAPKG